MNKLVFFSIGALVVTTGFTFLLSVKKETKKQTTANGFAIVELFTSEGCSSCPPADEAVKQIVKEYPENVYILGFHVDYWNYIGWTDVFSNPVYSERQREYANHFGLSSIYTPQVVVNGENEFVGSKEALLRTTVQEKLKEKPISGIVLSAKNSTAGNIIVSFKINTDEKNLLHIALVQLEATTAVKRGENGGRKLNHINVVREFKTIAFKNNFEATAKFKIPGGLVAKDLKLIAFLQNEADLKISGAAEAVIQ